MHNEMTYLFKASCGNPMIASQHRIVGGKLATHGAYPWQVELFSFKRAAHGFSVEQIVEALPAGNCSHVPLK